MYDEAWMFEAGAWAGLGVLIAIGAILTLASIIVFIIFSYGG